jgi:hypothetical protein
MASSSAAALRRPIEFPFRTAGHANEAKEDPVVGHDCGGRGAWRRLRPRGGRQIHRHRDDAYSDKIRQPARRPEERLDGFSVCEAKYFNNSDWYDRFGFIYYQFMADKYKR